MRCLIGEEAEEAMENFEKATEVAKKARCLKSHRGVIIVKDDEIIGKGYNAPNGDFTCRTCLRDTMKPLKFLHFNTEPCYAVQAELMALFDAFKKGYTELSDAVMYSVKVKNGEIIKSGGDSRTTCSKLVEHVNIGTVVLYEERGIIEYTGKEFNDYSFRLLD